MNSNQPTAQYLSDYLPPAFFIESVALNIDLDPLKTKVVASSKVSHNPDNPSKELVLDGINLELQSVVINGLQHLAYKEVAQQLIISDLPSDSFEIEITTHCSPQTNTSLEGLYLSDGAYCTQCEAQGFRKITYFLDRPDVMASYTVTIIADQAQFPHLLSNGNKIEQGELENGKHYAVWQDPFKKPSYLFALVAGDFDVLRDDYTTMSGRKVALELYVDKGNLSKAPHAMASLINAMKWDEQRFELEYDLDVYMIVAVDFFNMGAMENKGLNIFNSKCVLANEETSTDRDFHLIESIVGHEYFHNWTGNRVTCRDWFQLSLKEGLTVFRDQEFSSDLGSRALNRIDAVKVMRTHQFAEDAGPMAHPIRPEKVIEMNNFYTVTVYDKGAEVIRMLHTLLGEEGFQLGMKLYFQRHDGQAVTCDDFVSAMADANAIDLKHFAKWYSQSGTPVVQVAQKYNSEAQTYSLTLTQVHTPSGDQTNKENLVIPVAIELLNDQGEPVSLIIEGQSVSKVLQLSESTQTFTFEGIVSKPVAVVFEDFSAPVKVEFEQPLSEQLHIVKHASSEFSRWDAQQSALTDCIVQAISNQSEEPTLPASVIETLHSIVNSAVKGEEQDLALVAELLTLPSFDTLSARFSQIPMDDLIAVTQVFEVQIATSLEKALLHVIETFADDKQQNHQSAAIRALLNVAMYYLAKTNTASDYIVSQAQKGSMTTALGALKAMVCAQHDEALTQLNAFEQRWQDDVLVMDKWFNLQALKQGDQALNAITEHYEHAHFSWNNPNRVRALLGPLTMSNPAVFHHQSGEGYQVLGDALVKLNEINPQTASRLITPLLAWKRYDTPRQTLMKAQLRRLQSLPNLSKDLFEKVDKALA
ncbi:aminopeptidase N [Pseudoalteromonas sp. GB56]